MVDGVGPSIEATTVEWGEDTAAQFGGTFNLHDPMVTADLAGRSNRLVGAADTTWRAVRDTLIVGEAAGETMDQLEKRVGRVFSQAKGYRARMIARTEAVGAANAGSYLGARQTGVVADKVWLAAIDARTREWHVGADGQVKPMDKPFVVGAGKLMYPGDPQGGASNVINCRCTMLFRHKPNDLLGEETMDDILAIDGVEADGLVPKGDKPSALTKSPTTKKGQAVSDRTKVGRGVKTAKEAIDDIHGAPAGMIDEALPVIQTSGERTLGSFRFTKTGPVDLNVSASGPEAHQAFSFAHEFGHFFDYQDFGTAGQFATQTEAGAFEGYREAVRGTDAFKRLVELRENTRRISDPIQVTLEDGRIVNVRPDSRFVNYLLDDREVFARAYSQWVATESGDPLLQQGLNAMRNQPGQASIYPYQWEDEDFKPVAQALRALFKDQGLIE